MTLRRKSLVIVIGSFALLCLSLFVASYSYLFRGVLTLEQKDTEQNVQRAIKAISDEAENLDIHVHDWAQWDDTYQFIQGQNPDYVKLTLLDQTLSNAKLNIVVYLDLSGKLLYCKAFDLKENIGIQCPGDFLSQLTPGSKLAALPDPDSRVKGIVILGRDPLIAASRPILPSDGNGPVMGTLIMGRFLDQSKIRDISESTRLAVTLEYFNDPDLPSDFVEAKKTLKKEPVAVRSMDSQTVAGFGSMRDIYGKPALLVRVELHRSVYSIGASIIAFFLLIVLLISIGSAVLMTYLFHNQVISRLTSLVSSVSRIGAAGEPTEKLPVTGNDEITSLAVSINGMLDSLRSSGDALRQSEAKYRTLVENINIGVFRVDDDQKGKFLQANPSLARILGFEQLSELMDKSFSEFFLNKWDAQRFFDDLKREGQIKNREIRLQKSDETPIWGSCAASAQVESSSGRILWIDGVLEDITERKHAEDALIRYRNRLEELVEERTAELTKSYKELKREIEEHAKAEEALKDAKERLEATLSALPDIMFEVDKDGRFHDYRTPSVDKLYVTPDIFLGKTTGEVLPPETAKVLLAAINKVAETGDRTRVEYSLVIGGTEQYFEATLAPKGDLKDSKGRIIALVRDITLRKLAEAEIRQKNVELENLNVQLRANEEELMAQYEELEAVNQQLEANEKILSQQNEDLEAALRVKAEFLSMVSHELRTPLTPIIGYSALMLRGSCGAVPSNFAKPLEIILNRAKGLTTLIDDLLQLSQMERSALRINMETVSIRPFVSEIVTVYREMDHGKPIRLRWEGESFDVAADPVRLRQVMQNLLDNSIKYSGASVDILIETKKLGDLGLISITDNGIGISEDSLPRIFDRFYQIENVDTRAHGGAGLGLAIVKEVLQMMGGAISVTSAVGVSTTFTVGIPLAKIAVKESDPAPEDFLFEEPESKPAPKTATTYAKKILIVDDDVFTLDLVKTILGPHYEILTAQSAEKGMRIIRDSAPDLILLDLMMPDMDGMTMIANLKSDTAAKNIPIMIVSAKVEQESITSALNAGAIDIITKPFEPLGLLEKIKKVHEEYLNE